MRPALLDPRPLPNAWSSSLSPADSRLLVESVSDYAIFMLDPDGRVASWNRGALRIKGYLPEEIIGQHFSKFYPIEDIAARKPERELEIAKAEGRVEDEGWRLRKDGSRFWASVVITALLNEQGELRGFGKVTRDLTERKKADEILRQSEERFRLIVDGVQDYAIYMLDENGVVTTWNQGAERLTGYSAREILGSNFATFFPPEDVAAGKPARELEAARLRGRNEDEGYRVRKDGSRFWANATLTSLHDEQGRHVGFAKVTRDLTARRDAEAKARDLLSEHAARVAAEAGERRVRESEEKYRKLTERLEIVFENVADGIVAEDRRGCVVFANAAAARLFGCDSTEDLLAFGPGEWRDRLDILTEDGAPVTPEHFPSQRVLSSLTRTASGTFEIRSKDAAAERWVSVRAGSVLDDGGHADLAITIWHDVTVERHEQRRVKYVAEATLALGSSLDEKAMLGALARALVPGLAARCAIHLAEGDGLTRVAAAGAESDVVRQANESEASAHEAALRRAVTSGETAVLKGGLFAPIAARSLALGVIAFERSGSDHPYTRADLLLAEELGRRAGVALENARLYADAQRAVRAADQASRAKDEFLATVSHELRTPLSAILGWSQMLKERVTDPALKKPLDVVHRNALAQVRIIDDILEVSRIITGKFQIEVKPADLVAIARDAIEAVRPSAAHKRLDLRFEPSAEYRFLTADPDRLQQAVWNLLTNAVKFTKEGGSIVVREWQVGPELFLSVSDTGAGIAPEFLPHVFDRFWQADSSTTRRVGGLGLGLALVRHIVERHGGTVEVASTGVGQGATFTLRVPVQASQQPVPESWEGTADPPRVLPTKGVLVGLRVLVVDDEEDARDVIACSLGEAGAMVEAVGSATEALPRLSGFHPHVLVSDIGMPGEDGFALIRRVRSLPDVEARRVPALALTAFARAEDRAQAIAAGFTAHLGKPVTPDTLVQRVRELARPA